MKGKFRLDEYDNSIFSVEFDFDKKKITFSSDVEKFLDGVEDVILWDHKKESRRVVSLPVCISEYYDDFKFLIRGMLGLEYKCMELGVEKWFVPKGLDLQEFEKIKTFDGVVEYYRGLKEEYLPNDFRNNLELNRFFNPCPVCCGEDGYKDEKSRSDVLISDGELHIFKTNGSSSSIKVDFCPICGRPVQVKRSGRMGKEIKTLGDFRRLTKDLDDDYKLDVRIMKPVPAEECAKRRYPFPWDMIDGRIEYHDISFSDKDFCIGIYEK